MATGAPWGGGMTGVRLRSGDRIVDTLDAPEAPFVSVTQSSKNVDWNGGA